MSGEALEEAEDKKTEGEGQQAANGTPAAITEAPSVSESPKPPQEKKDD